MSAAKPLFSVIGSGSCDEETAAVAHRVGELLARAGAVVITGGLGGVMAAASRGAQEAGGETIGLLPGCDRREANQWVTLALATGLSEARNALVATLSDGVVAIGGELGTLSEIALALRHGLPVATLDSWPIDGERLDAGRRLEKFTTAEEAVRWLAAETGLLAPLPDLA